MRTIEVSRLTEKMLKRTKGSFYLAINGKVVAAVRRIAEDVPVECEELSSYEKTEIENFKQHEKKLKKTAPPIDEI